MRTTLAVIAPAFTSACAPNLTTTDEYAPTFDTPARSKKQCAADMTCTLEMSVPPQRKYSLIPD